MSGRVILNLNEQLIQCIDTERNRIGATRNGIVARILEKYFVEKQEKQELYDVWFMAEVEKSIKSAGEQPLVDHEDVVKQVHNIITEARERNAAKVV
ncbi:MAG: hypothetical protein FWF87_06140 [Synergistaceae bacterium]|nr:hypothetical protein [Synergistaceae bacterium]